MYAACKSSQCRTCYGYSNVKIFINIAASLSKVKAIQNPNPTYPGIYINGYLMVYAYACSMYYKGNKRRKH